MFHQFQMGIRTTGVFLAAAAVAVVGVIGAVVASPQQCGIVAVTSIGLVSHGRASSLGQWPWHGALFHKTKENAASYACGVTVVSNFYTLTAAHCLIDKSYIRNLIPKDLLIRLGISNLDQTEHSLQQFAVTKIIGHEGYSSLSNGNDIALLKVAHEIEFNDYVRPICFWRGDDSNAGIVGKNGYSPGWGLDEHEHFAKELKYAVMPIASREQCRQSDPNYYTKYLFDNNAFCAGSRNGTTVSNGDSGGGLYLLVDNVWYLRGIVSSGKSSRIGRIDAFNFIVYTDVAHYLPWVKQTLDITITDDKYAECGIKNVNSSDRSQANPRPWPWHGEVYRNGSKPRWLGDSVIINRKFVLSQASIFALSDYKDPFRLMVLFKASKKEAETIIYKVLVKAIIPIKKMESPQKENNIAILELDKPLIFSENIRPICLWRGNEDFSRIKDTHVYLGRIKTIPSPGRQCARSTNPKDAIANSLCVRTTKREYVRMFSSNIMFLQYNGKWFARGITYGGAKNGSTYFIYLLDLALYTGWIDQSIAERSEMLLPLSSCVTGSAQDWNLQLHSNSNLCYGSLVTPYLILTTASCMADFNQLNRNTNLQIRNSKKSEFEVVNITEVFKHPHFHEVHLTHNVALVQIEQPFDADPVCIPTKPANSRQLYFSTWQSTTTGLNQSLTLTNMNDCSAEWRKQKIFVNLEGGHICGQLNSTPNCQQDLSGSPLSYRIRKKQFLQGILDFGKTENCAVVPGLPAGFINVTYYSSWIYQTFETVISRRANSAPQESQNDEVDEDDDVHKKISSGLDIFREEVMPRIESIAGKLTNSSEDGSFSDVFNKFKNWFKKV